MKTFKILGNEIVIDEEFLDYIKFYHQKEKYLEEYNLNFINFHQNYLYINTFNELITYTTNFYNYMKTEFENISQKALSILVSFGIYDKSIDDIKNAANSALIKFETYMLESFKKLKEIKNDLTEKLSDLEDMIKNKAAQNFKYNTDVFIGDPWTVGFLEISQASENRRVDMARKIYFNINYNRSKKKLINALDNSINDLYINFKSEVHNYTNEAISEILEQTLKILFQEGKIQKFVIANLQTNRSKNILENIKNISDIKIKKEQLVSSLQINLISKENHYEILKLIKNSVEAKEYINLIVYLNLENIIINICLDTLENNSRVIKKPFQILKLLDTTYFKNFLNLMHYTPSTDIQQDIIRFKNIFDIIKNIWGNDNIDILNKESYILKSFENVIIEQYNIKSKNVIEPINFDNVKKFFVESKQKYTLYSEKEKNLKKKQKILIYIFIVLSCCSVCLFPFEGFLQKNFKSFVNFWVIIYAISGIYLFIIVFSLSIHQTKKL